MSAHVVNNILAQVNQQRNAEAIKKLLFLKLEIELNSTRAIITGTKETPPEIMDVIETTQS